MRNRAGMFSVGRLIDFLTALDQDVAVIVRPTLKEHGQMSAAVVSRRIRSARLYVRLVARSRSLPVTLKR